jgi:hypothetical protein
MKKIFVMLFSVILVAFLATSFTNTKSAVDKDVGYSLTIDQNITIMNTIPVEPLSILLSRGVSVPDKGLISSDALIVNNQESFTCSIYYTIDRIDLKLPTLNGFENQIDKYPFASDLGLRKS